MMLFEQCQNVCNVMLAFAGTALRFFRGNQFQRNQIRDRRDTQPEATIQIQDLGVCDGIGDSQVFCGKLDGCAQLERTRAWRAPIVAGLVPTCVLETGAKKGCTRHIGVSGPREVYVERTPGVLRVNLHSDSAY